MRTNTLLPLWVGIVLPRSLQSVEPGEQVVCQLKLSTKLDVRVWDPSKALCYMYFNEIRTERSALDFFQCCTLDKRHKGLGVVEPSTSEWGVIWGVLYRKCLPSKKENKKVGWSAKENCQKKVC